jgi:hypothetical protein
MGDQQNERIIRWLKDGNTVVIVNEQELTTKLLPAFNIMNHFSFTQQLEKLGFRRVEQGYEHSGGLADYYSQSVALSSVNPLRLGTNVSWCVKNMLKCCAASVSIRWFSPLQLCLNASLSHKLLTMVLSYPASVHCFLIYSCVFDWCSWLLCCICLLRVLYEDNRPVA